MMKKGKRGPREVFKQQAQDLDLAQFLFSHGDVSVPLASTIRTLDSITTDYIIQICFGAGQSAALHGRAKIKVDDVLYALRDNPLALGRIEEQQKKEKGIKKTRKAVDPSEEAIEKGLMGEILGEEKKGKGRKRKADGPAADDFGGAFKKNVKGGKGKAFA